MGRIKSGIPRKIKHSSFACSEEELDVIHLTAAALRMSPSALVRMLVLEKYNDLIRNKFFTNLELKTEEA